MPNWLFLLTQIRRRLWLTVTLYSVLGVFTALIAAQVAPYVPVDIPLKIGSEAVDEILTILASSMLAVATFSLTTLVAAYTSVAANVAPHAARLLVSDGAIRSALATFVGAFIFSIVGIVAVHTGYYGAQGRVILFFVTLVVLLLVVLAMVRWIGQLSDLAQTDAVIDRVADVAADALRSRLAVEGWLETDYAPPDQTLAVRDARVGYVDNIDLRALEKLAEAHTLTVYVEATPGDFVHAAQPLLLVAGNPRLPTEVLADLRSTVSIGSRRTFDQDPRYGMTVLGEIASRALSPGINDPGTARDVISKAVRVLADWSTHMKRNGESERSRQVRVRPLSAEGLLEDVFGPVVRDGGRFLPLQIHLQEAMSALASVGDDRMAQAARRQAGAAVERASEALQFSDDRRRLAECASSSRQRPL